MLIFLNWLIYLHTLRQPDYKTNYWLREQMREHYIFARTIAFIGDVILIIFLCLLFINLFLT